MRASLRPAWQRVGRPAATATASSARWERPAWLLRRAARTATAARQFAAGVSAPSGALPARGTRGKRTRTVRLEDLPQGIVMPPPPPTSVEEEGPPSSASSDLGEDTQPPAYPTVIQQARRNMDTFADCVLLTRVGGFYEMYFEHAQEFGPLLHLKVASKRTSAGAVPMSGFPFFQLDRFLKVLVCDLNRSVAVAEEFPNEAADRLKAGGLMHDRRVARIVTAGTLIDENFMDPYSSNYVMALHGGGHGVAARAADDAAPTASPDWAASSLGESLGLAWLDLSTGHFYTQPTTLAGLASVLARVAPRELVLDARWQAVLAREGGSSSSSSSSHPLAAILDEGRQQQQLVVTFGGGGAAADLAAGLGPGVAAWTPYLESELPADVAAAFTPPEVAAGSLLLHYVKDRLRGLAMKLQPPVRYAGLQVMTIDKNSMRALEIKQTLRDGAFRGSLLHAIRRTVTKSGARLLTEWLSAPSTSLAVIEARQDLVARFLADEDRREGVTQLLRRSYDAHRLVQKFALGRGDPDDLLDLAKTIAATEAVVGLLEPEGGGEGKGERDTPSAFASLTARIELARPRALAQQIRSSVDEEGLQHQHDLQDDEADAMMALAEEAVQAEGAPGEQLRKKTTSASAASAAASSAAARKRRQPSIRDHYGEDNEAWVMKPTASAGLQALHAQLAALTSERHALADELRRRLHAPSLVLKWTPGLGHICHVRGRDARAPRGRTDPGGEDPGKGKATTLSSSRTTRSLHVPEWTALGQRLDQVRFQIRAEEQRVFATLRAAVVRSLVPLRRNAAVLDELDIASSFARLAHEHGWCRPRLHGGTTTAIVGGRHPTVEGGLAERGVSFTKNDLFLGTGDGVAHGAAAAAAVDGAQRPAALWLITGPNMGGKSTFLRQSALLAVLAQVGSYVPAEAADMGLVDALFSRVGSADNLFRDQSTFMVEMLETAHILREATPRSLVIMDEIGRGTTPADGTAVAFAALHHLVHVNRCRALFATHFHDLVALAEASGLVAPAGAPLGAPAGYGYPVALYCTDVEEDSAGGFVYVHRLRRGINRQSHALKVARLAGLPDAAIRVAEQVLAGHRDEPAGPGAGVEAEARRAAGG